MWGHNFATFDDIILQHLMTSFCNICIYLYDLHILDFENTKVKKIISEVVESTQFLGGLSLHLKHLIA